MQVVSLPDLHISYQAKKTFFDQTPQREQSKAVFLTDLDISLQTKIKIGMNTSPWRGQLVKSALGTPGIFLPKQQLRYMVLNLVLKHSPNMSNYPPYPDGSVMLGAHTYPKSAPKSTLPRWR